MWLNVWRVNNKASKEIMSGIISRCNQLFDFLIQPPKFPRKRPWNVKSCMIFQFSFLNRQTDDLLEKNGS